LGTVYPERRARWLISQSPDDSPYNSTEVPSNIPTSRRSTSTRRRGVSRRRCRNRRRFRLIDLKAATGGAVFGPNISPGKFVLNVAATRPAYENLS